MEVEQWKSLAQSVTDILRKTDAAARTASQTGNLNARKREIKAKVTAIRDGDFRLLSNSLEKYRNNPRLGATQTEIAAFTTRLETIRSTISSIEQVCNRSDNARSKLLSDAHQSRPRRNVEETEETIDMSSRQLLDQQLQQRENDDEALDEISQGLFSLKQIGMEHSKQFHRQDALLDELHDGVDNTQRKLNHNIASVDKVEKGTRGGCCTIIVMAGLLAFILSLIFSNWACHVLPKANC